MAGVVAFAQRDVKSLIAFSRIVHIGPTVLGLLSGVKCILLGAVIMAAAHGLVRSGLFFRFTLTYQAAGSRTLVRVSGGFTHFLRFRMLAILLVLINASMPITLPLIRELLSFVGLAAVSIHLDFMQILCYLKL